MVKAAVFNVCLYILPYNKREGFSSIILWEMCNYAKGIIIKDKVNFAVYLLFKTPKARAALKSKALHMNAQYLPC